LEALLRQSEAFRQFAEARYAPGSWSLKYPLEAQQGRRTLKMEVDLLLENENAAVAILFGGFAEGMKKWKTQAQTLLPAAGWLNRLLPKIFPGKTIRYLFVFPFEGQAVPVRLSHETGSAGLFE